MLQTLAIGIPVSGPPAAPKYQKSLVLIGILILLQCSYIITIFVAYYALLNAGMCYCY